MSASNNSASPAAAAEKVKKITLSAQSTKYMVFGNWFIDRLVAGGQMTPDSVTESRKILGMWSSVEDQIALYDGFVADLKTNTKELKTLIRQFHKPPKAAKKAKTPASEGEKKRGRKKKEVTEELDPILALNERIVAAAQSEEPIVTAPQMEYIRAPKAPDSQPQEEIKTPERPTQEQIAIPAKPERPAKKKATAPVVEEVKELTKADAKAAKEAAKLAEKAAKEAAKLAEKVAKEAEKEAAKAAKEAEKEAAKAAKAAAKPVKEPKKKVEAVAVAAVLPMPVLVRNSPPNAVDDEEEEELECEVFKCDGVEYLIDSTNTVYDRNTQEMIGTYDSSTKTIHKC